MMPFELPLGVSSADALASAALVSILLIGWWITERTLRHRDDLSSQAASRWTANVRNAMILIAVVGLLMIWAPQLRTFALSLTAVAVAIVIATKELILCLSASAYRTFTQAYVIGDIVEIEPHRGRVDDISLLSTNIVEFDGPEGSIRLRGSTVTVPHSLLFSTPARVLAKKGVSSHHAFALVFEPAFDLFSRVAELKEVADIAYANYADANQDRSGVPPSLDLALATTDIGKLHIRIRAMATSESAGEMERAISNAIGSFVFSQCGVAKA